MTQVVDAVAGKRPNELFSGFDSVADGLLSTSAVEGEFEKGGTITGANIKVCQSMKELAQALEINASVSLSILKAVNVTAKMSFMNSLNVTEHSVNVVVHVAKMTGSWRITDVALKPGIKVPTNDAEAARFVREYGDSYVNEATQGGEYYAVYTFRTTSREEKQSLTAELKAKGVYSGVTVETDVQVKLTNFLSEWSEDWSFKQEMTGIKGLKLPQPDGIIDFALDFPEKKINSAVTTGYTVRRYDRVPGFGDGFGAVNANRTHFTGDEGVLPRLGRLRGIAHQISRLKDIHAVYKFSDPDLEALRNKVAADIRTIDRQVEAWRKNAAGEFTDPDLPSVAFGEPVLAYNIGQTVSFGAGPGPNFDFMSVGEAFRNQVRIDWIRLSGGDYGTYKVVLQMEVGYASENGSWKTVHGLTNHPGDKFTLGKGHFPSMLRIRHGGYVDRIELELRDGRTTEAGGTNGASAKWEAKSGEILLGFAGRAGAVLDQIRIIYGSLKPSTYVQPH
jgi:hypothetical protein